MNKIDVFLFDLGRVLVELDGPPLKQAWVAEVMSDEESWRRWGGSSLVKAFESGEISPSDFCSGLVQEQNLTISPEAFKQAFVQWPKAVYPGVERMLQSLKADYTLAFYSNTSELHVPRLMSDMGLGQYFDYGFASCEIGHFKPDESGFHHIIRQLEVPAERFLFIDDNLANVQAAQQVGMNAEQAEGFEAVAAVVNRWR
ncbi:MAG TPA: HAD-IA family hydrolase [Marinagarivorans sp.]